MRKIIFFMMRKLAHVELSIWLVRMGCVIVVVYCFIDVMRRQPDSRVSAASLVLVKISGVLPFLESEY